MIILTNLRIPSVFGGVSYPREYCIYASTNYNYMNTLTFGHIVVRVCVEISRQPAVGSKNHCQIVCFMKEIEKRASIFYEEPLLLFMKGAKEPVPGLES